MTYCFIKTLETDMDGAVQRVTEALKGQGFGILTDIDVRATFKKKIDGDFRPYRILGAFDPPFALRAMTAEPDIGTMLPYNVVLQEMESGRIRVSAIDPVASMMAVENEELSTIATEGRSMLECVISTL